MDKTAVHMVSIPVWLVVPIALLLVVGGCKLLKLVFVGNEGITPSERLLRRVGVSAVSV